MSFDEQPSEKERPWVVGLFGVAIIGAIIVLLFRMAVE